VAIIEADALPGRFRELSEKEQLRVSEARGAMDEWAAKYGYADGRLVLPSAATAGPAAASGSSESGALGGGLDELIAPADARSAELLRLKAEERALRDTLSMVAALQADGKLSAAAFVKATRGLSRELFFAHAAVLELRERR
jgi:hypothetical protein